jgi:long-chain fatty acid transport protein
LASGVAAAYNGFGLPYDQIDPGEIEVKQSTVYGFTVGASYALSDAWSLALGARHSRGVREFDGKATISSTNPFVPPKTLSLNLQEEADGWAGIVGVNFTPNDKFSTALTFISNTKMNYNMDVKRDTLGITKDIGFPDGSNRRIDIPATLGFGASYRFLPELKVDLNYTYYFEKYATIDTYDNEGDSWDLALSAEYTFNPRWKASLGYMRTEISVSDNQQINEPEEPKLDANSVAAGLVWSPIPDLSFTLGGLYAMYDEVKDDNGIEYDKTVWNASFGVQYRFF